MPRRRWLVVAAVVAFVAGFAAVLVQREAGGVRSIAVEERDGLPPGVAPTGGSGWVLRDDGLVDVWTGGSSSCPWVPVAVELSGGTLRVSFDDVTPPGGACTADVAFRTATIRPPRPLGDGVDVELVFADRT